MRPFMRNYLRVFDVVNMALRYLLAALLLVMTLLIGWQVFARFVVGESLTFSEEISRFAMIWLVVLGAAYAAQNGRLIKVDILEHLLGGTVRKAAIVLAGCLSIVFYLILVVFGLFIVDAVAFQRTPATEMSMSIPLAALPVGGIFLVLNTIYHLFATMLGVRQASEVDEIVAEAGEGTS